jgi:hypothetical protein
VDLIVTVMTLTASCVVDLKFVGNALQIKASPGESTSHPVYGLRFGLV